MDLRPTKEGVAGLLPPNHPLRVALATEPDILPEQQGSAKLVAYLRLAFALREHQ